MQLTPITDTERLLLIEKKEEIRKITEEILDKIAKWKMEDNCKNEKEIYEVEKKLIHTLSLLYQIASYAEPDRDLNLITRYTLITIFATRAFSGTVTNNIVFICVLVNAITFNYKPGMFAGIRKIGFSVPPGVGINFEKI